MEMIIAILLPLIFGAALPFLKIQNRKIANGTHPQHDFIIFFISSYLCLWGFANILQDTFEFLFSKTITPDNAI